MKATKPKMNVRLLRRIQKQILKEPRQFNMQHWFTNRGGQAKIPNCGTAACIAGWACALNKKLNPATAKERYGIGVFSEAPSVARKALGLPVIGAEALFHVTGWPYLFQDEFTKAKTPHQRAKIAVDRIDHFIKTKGAE